jgi:hypothetical protein
MTTFNIEHATICYPIFCQILPAEKAEAKDLTAALHAACSEGHRKLVAPLCKGKADVMLGVGGDEPSILIKGDIKSDEHIYIYNIYI